MCGLSRDLGLAPSIRPLCSANRWQAPATLPLCVTCLSALHDCSGDLHCVGYAAFPESLGTAALRPTFAPYQHRTALLHVTLQSHCFPALRWIGALRPSPSHDPAPWPPPRCSYGASASPGIPAGESACALSPGFPLAAAVEQPLCHEHPPCSPLCPALHTAQSVLMLWLGAAFLGSRTGRFCR